MASTTKTFNNGTTPQVEDVDLNGLKNENNNLITGSGQSLNTGDSQQTQKAVSAYAAGGDFYTDSGTTTDYILTPVGSKLAPAAYFDGMRVRFIPDNTNTGATNIKVGSLALRQLRMRDGAVSIASSIMSGYLFEAVYNSGTGFFESTLVNPVAETVRGAKNFNNSANVYNGINQQNLLDKTANESITGNHNFGSGNLLVNGRELYGPTPVNNFVTSQSINININGYGGTLFDVQSELAEDTWETIGPSGSGANNIWIALDDIPLSANFLIMRSVITATAYNTIASTTVSSSLYAQRVSGTTKNFASRVTRLGFTGSIVNPSVSYGIQGQITNESCILPLSANNRINILYDNIIFSDSGTPLLQSGIFIVLIGWLE